METELEDFHESEQRWAAKQKRAIEQVDPPEPGSVSVPTRLLGF